MPGLTYDSTGLGGDGGLLYGSDDNLMEGCCCGEPTPYYRFVSCASDTLTDIYVLASAAPFVPDAMNLWTIFDATHQACLYTDGTTGTPGTILAADEYSTLDDCFNPVCGTTDEPIGDPTESDCECPEESGEFMPDQITVTLNGTGCVCADALSTLVTNLPQTAVCVGSGCSWGGYIYIEFDSYPFGCENLATSYEALASVAVGYSGGSWSCVISIGTYYEKSDGTPHGSGPGLFTNSSDLGAGDCTGVTLNDDSGAGCTASSLVSGGVVTITVPVLPP